jgi:response regulator RpfG family c-di-GMP phosphodiesterase
MSAAASAVPVDKSPGVPPTLLCVDDEANILASLKRLFRPLGYRVLTAAGGAEALALLEKEQVDLIISDMRMPEMDGAQFLERARALRPDTIRILLTGYSDADSTAAAINRGEIYRYITKPWNDHEVGLIVRRALERRKLEQEQARLEDLTRQQNEELKQLNTGLEAKVEQRTVDLRRALESLAAANTKLKESFVTSIKVFASLMDLRGESEGGHSRRVADLARRLAQKLGFDQAATQDVMLAGLLHDIGKIGLPDKLVSRPIVQLSSEELEQLKKHPVRGAAVLMGLEPLREGARLLRAHRERFDGLGYPEGLSGSAIPLGASILAVASDFDTLQMGMLTGKILSRADACAFIQQAAGKRYDPAVVEAFLDLVGQPAVKEAGKPEIAVRATDLVPGMVLTRDILSRQGVLLLAAGYLVDETLTRQMLAFEQSSGEQLRIFVRPPKG